MAMGWPAKACNDQLIIGWEWGVALTIATIRVSKSGWLLLLFYLLWSQIGTLASWQAQRLNRYQVG